jgi:hypothetical protein
MTTQIAPLVPVSKSKPPKLIAKFKRGQQNNGATLDRNAIYGPHCGQPMQERLEQTVLNRSPCIRRLSGTSPFRRDAQTPRADKIGAAPRSYFTFACAFRRSAQYRFIRGDTARIWWNRHCAVGRHHRERHLPGTRLPPRS